MIPNPKRFRVSLSFAGEKRPYVQEVAAKLSAEIGWERVLYDQYYKAEFAQPNLDTYLQRLYHDESDLIVVFLCADYADKDWCGLELRAIRDLIKRRTANIMPIRFDDTEIPGLFSIDGYIRVDGHRPEEIADLILQRANPALGCSSQGNSGRKPTSSTAKYKAPITAPAIPSTSVVVTNTGQGVAVGVVNGTINIGIDAKQFQEMLDERDRTLVAELRSADPKDKQRIQELEAEKKALEQQLANFAETFKEYQAKLAELAKELESWRGSVSDESLNTAQQALARGDTQAADHLFAGFIDSIKRKRDAEDSNLAQAYYQRGGLAELRIDYGQAMRHYTDAVQTQPNNPTYLRAAGAMARTVGRYEQARIWLEHAVELLGQQAPDTLDWAGAAYDLAWLYTDIADYAQAEPLYLRDLAITEKALGKDHPAVATTLNNLALLYRVQGHYAQAEPLYLRAIEIAEFRLGADHPNTVTFKDNYQAMLRAKPK